MYDVKQFRPALYVVLLMGVTGFALATQSLGTWLLICLIILFNAWLVGTGRFTPLPRFWANLFTLSAMGLMVFLLYGGEAVPILTISQFIIVLQLIKLFEQRENRDYGQLLVLSLLLMVAAAISTADLLFGVTFIFYLFASLYCCLLFHLKAETDRAKAVYGRPEDKINLATLRQDQRYLTRSMRRLTMLVSTFAITMGVLVFLFFPRAAVEGMFTQIQIRTTQPLTGFSDRVSFQKVAQITQSSDVIARVELYDHYQRITVGRPLLLRGSALDSYSGNGGPTGREGQWQWSRSDWISPGDEESGQLSAGEIVGFWPGTDPGYHDDYSAQYRLVINLEPTGTNKLFTVAGLFSLRPVHPLRFHYYRHDEVLESVDPLNTSIQYSIICTGKLVPVDSPYPRYNEEGPSMIDPAVAEFARRPEVCGTDEAGKPLALHPLAGDHSFDARIASNFENYLHANYQYTLDLTDVKSFNGRDPLAAFLTDFKRGHCEYFAGAMTLLCQSLTIPARMVVGFRCGADDFNTLGNYFSVKQSNAHSWCEVFTGAQWQTYDPTTDAGSEALARQPTVLARLLKVFDFLEYKWATSVIAYSRDDRRSLADAADFGMSRSAVGGSQRMAAWSRSLHIWWQNMQWNVPSTLLSVVLGLVLAALAVCVAWFIFERWRLRRRAKRIGLELTPTQLRLARQLEFYDALVRVLEKHKIVRARNLTPLEFSRSLSFLPNKIYNDVWRITQIFYRVRYGTTELNSHRQSRLLTVVHRIQHRLDSSAGLMPR